MPAVSCSTLFSLLSSSMLPPQALYPPPHPEAALGRGHAAGTPAGQPASAGAAPQPGLEGRGWEGRPHLQPPEGRSSQRNVPKTQRDRSHVWRRAGYASRAMGCPAPHCTGRCPFLALTRPCLHIQPVFGTWGPCQMVTLVGKGLCRGRHRCRNHSMLCQGGGGEHSPSPKQPESNRFYFMSRSLTSKGKKKRKSPALVYPSQSTSCGLLEKCKRSAGFHSGFLLGWSLRTPLSLMREQRQQPQHITAVTWM